MNFRDLSIERKYRSCDYDNIGAAFLSKVLPFSTSYKRAVGFFSSSSLIYTSKGLLTIASKHQPGQPPAIRFIVSPKLSKEDVEAIKKGYKTKQEVIEESMLREFKEVNSEKESERLNILCHLIASGAMDIKVAVTNFADDDIGMYHEKIGIMTDESGNTIGFSGSLNESENAFVNNFESIKVYKSWDSSTSLDLLDLNEDFEMLWSNNTKRVSVLPFPRAVHNKLFEYKKETYNKNIDEEETRQEAIDDLYKLIHPSIDKNKLPSFPYDYQKKAIEKWFAHKCRGIFEMATGTGKTFTGYGAMVKLLERAKYHLFTVIVCPYQHLVEQWVEDASYFNISNMIVGYSNGKYSNYLSLLKKAVQDYNDGIIPYAYFITTNASFKTEKVQNVLKQLNSNSLFVADEAHNLGSTNFGKCLLDNFKYRLALSATFDRYRDEEGTNQIYNYFGEKCIEYPLSKAIDEDKLSKYKYFAIPTYLTEEERRDYLKYTQELSKGIFKTKTGETKLKKTAEIAAIKRARLIAGSSGKIEAFKKEILKHINEKYMLIYCGTSKIIDEDNEEIDQVNLITQYLGNDLKMDVGRYTSRETVEERIAIKNRFKDGGLKALVAIKCLDEGVNIPAIRTAFLLASSTNPREYIQRRGRVLRKSDNKDFAVIYDFVTLPVEPKELGAYSEEELKSFRTLINNELRRIKEFGIYSVNSKESDLLCEQIKNNYKLYNFEEIDDFDLNLNEEDD